MAKENPCQSILLAIALLFFSFPSILFLFQPDYEKNMFWFLTMLNAFTLLFMGQQMKEINMTLIVLLLGTTCSFISLVMCTASIYQKKNDQGSVMRLRLKRAKISFLILFCLLTLLGWVPMIQENNMLFKLFSLLIATSSATLLSFSSLITKSSFHGTDG